MAVKAQMSGWPEKRLELQDMVRPLTCIDHDRIIVRALPVQSERVSRGQIPILDRHSPRNLL